MTTQRRKQLKIARSREMLLAGLRSQENAVTAARSTLERVERAFDQTRKLLKGVPQEALPSVEAQAHASLPMPDAPQNPIDPDELTAQLQQIVRGIHPKQMSWYVASGIHPPTWEDTPELCHQFADEVIIACLRSLGYGAAMDIYEAHTWTDDAYQG